MNILFFEITPTTATGSSQPIGLNPKIEISDLYSDDSIELNVDKHSHIKTFSYNEETGELLVIRPEQGSAPAA